MTTSEQIRAARALLRWEQKDLAEASKVSLPSIKRLETIPGDLAAQGRTIDALKGALEAGGVIFVEENGEGPGVRLKKKRKGTKEHAESAANPVQVDIEDAIAEAVPAIEPNPPQYHGMETPAEPDAGVSRVRSPLKRFNR
ncbi:MAG: hypothetical protein WDN46_12780 [Methylocella sp.]